MRISSDRLIRADKNGDEKNAPDSFSTRRTRRSFPSLVPAADPAFPIESYLNGSYALIDPFRRLKVSPKYRASERASERESA